MEKSEVLGAPCTNLNLIVQVLIHPCGLKFLKLLHSSKGARVLQKQKICNIIVDTWYNMTTIECCTIYLMVLIHNINTGEKCIAFVVTEQTR